MPLDFVIDHGRRLVTARARGTLTSDDLFAYQREVWSRADVAGFDELVDMSEVERIEPATQIAQLARLSAGMDPPHLRSKFAVVAPDDLSYGLGRAYQTHRSLEECSTKEVRIFRSLGEALDYLGVREGPPALEPGRRRS